MFLLDGTKTQVAVLELYVCCRSPQSALIILRPVVRRSSADSASLKIKSIRAAQLRKVVADLSELHDAVKLRTDIAAEHR